jgi:MFS family permease
MNTATKIQPPNCRSWIALIAVSFSLLLINVDYTAMNLAIMPIQKTFNQTLANVQWIISIYSIMWAGFVVIGGKIADILGRRTIFLIGLALFILASISSMCSVSLLMLIMSRAAQGIASGLFYPAAMALAFLAFPAKQKGLAIGVLSSLSALGLAIGPSISGILIHAFGWRSVFFINIPLCGTIAFFVVKYIALDAPRKQAKFDYLGALLLLTIIISFLFGVKALFLTGKQQYSPLFILALFACFILALAYCKRKKSPPLIPFSEISSSFFWAASLVRLVLQFSFASLLLLMTLYLRKIGNYTIPTTGLILLSFTLLFVCISPFGGKIVDSLGVCWPIVVGMLMFSLTLLVLAHQDTTPNLSTIILMLLLGGGALGLVYPALGTVALKSVGENAIGVASGIFTMCALLGVTLGVLTTSFVITKLGNEKLMPLLFASGMARNPQVVKHLVQTFITSNVKSAPHVNFSQPLLKALVVRSLNVYIQAYKKMLVLCSLFCALSSAFSYYKFQDNT